MDYRNLLIKYMHHVFDCEGTNFINEWELLTTKSGGKFTQEEKDELINLDKGFNA